MKQTKNICCFFRPCSITKMFCAPMAKIKLSPVKNPKIAVAVLVENGGGGSSVAGPVARQVVDSYLAVN